MDPCVGIPGMTGSYWNNRECVGKGAPDGGMRRTFPVLWPSAFIK